MFPWRRPSAPSPLDGQLDLLRDSVQRERALTATRVASTQSRATLLTGLAGVVAGADAALGSSPLSWVAYLFFAVAALAGISVLLPGRARSAPNAALEKELALYPTTADLKWALLQHELMADARAASLVRHRSIILIAGLSAWAIGVALIVVGAATAPDPPPADPLRIQIVE